MTNKEIQLVEKIINTLDNYNFIREDFAYFPNMEFNLTPNTCLVINAGEEAFRIGYKKPGPNEISLKNLLELRKHSNKELYQKFDVAYYKALKEMKIAEKEKFEQRRLKRLDDILQELECLTNAKIKS